MKLVALIVAVLAVVAGVYGLGVWIQRSQDATQRRICAALGARAVATGRSEFLCVSPDGRVVGP